MATTSSVGDVPVEFQLPRQGGARRGGHDDGGDDLVVLPPGGATPHAARSAGFNTQRHAVGVPQLTNGSRSDLASAVGAANGCIWMACAWDPSGHIQIC